MRESNEGRKTGNLFKITRNLAPIVPKEPEEEQTRGLFARKVQ